ncbi:MAG TPA: GIY-YIG nuclease family protein [Candidatus Paceibacterota bacterium]
MYFVYMARNLRDKLYIGISENLSKRIKYHNTKRGAKFTNGGNFEIVFIEKYQTLEQARRREIQIEKWRREKKELLIGRHSKGSETKI